MIILLKQSQSKSEKKKTTEAYKEKMNEDIETIDKNENSKKIVQKTKWRPISSFIFSFSGFEP